MGAPWDWVLMSVGYFRFQFPFLHRWNLCINIVQEVQAHSVLISSGSWTWRWTQETKKANSYIYPYIYYIYIIYNGFIKYVIIFLKSNLLEKSQITNKNSVTVKSSVYHDLWRIKTYTIVKSYLSWAYRWLCRYVHMHLN